MHWPWGTQHSRIPAWRIPWTEEPVGYSPWGCKESDTTERVSMHSEAAAKYLANLVLALLPLGALHPAPGSPALCPHRVGGRPAAGAGEKPDLLSELQGGAPRQHPAASFSSPPLLHPGCSHHRAVHSCPSPWSRMPASEARPMHDFELPTPGPLFHKRKQTAR